MKKNVFITLAMIVLACTLQAQNISKNALGLRLGDSDGFGGEISYQRKMKKDNRLEFDLGWRNSKYVSAFKLVGVYQWVWTIEGNFNWYAGLGGGVGTWSFDDKFYNSTSTGTFALLAGDLGIEYNFDFPLQISLDARPEFGINRKYIDNNLGFDIALGLRYKFD
jgi:hypothetical protein